MEADRTEVGGPLWKSCESSWKFAILVEVGGGIQGCMEAHGSFHGICSWKLRLMEAMEPSNSVYRGKFHVLSWKPILTSMEVNLLTLASISMEVKLLPPTSMEVSWK